MPTLLPARGVWIPAAIAYDKEIPASALDTYVKLKGLAWQNGTVEITMPELQAITGKGHSVLYGHMALLRDRCALRWRATGRGTLMVSFEDDTFSEKPEYSGKPETPVNIPPNSIKSIDSNASLESSIREKNFTGGINGAGNSGKPETIPENRKASPKNRNVRSDPRSQSPAIQCAKGITRKYPPLQLYDDVILVLGDAPDGKRAAECYKAWLARGYNPNSYNWLLEWYVTGIPERNGSKPTRKGGYNPDVFEDFRKEKSNAKD